MYRNNKILVLASLPFLATSISACADDVSSSAGTTLIGTDVSTTGDGDSDSADSNSNSNSGDGDGEPGDGDGDGGPGDGDGSPGDGDGDGSPGDGDGDGSPGDGDGGPGDGDGAPGDGDGAPNNCMAPPSYTDCDGAPGNLTNNPFNALGINCGNDPTTTVVAQNAMMNSSDQNAWRVITQFGSPNQLMGQNHYNGKLWAANLDNWISPNDEEIPNNTSSAILILSTGRVAAANNQGVVTEAPGSQEANGANGNQDNGGLPSPLSPYCGSNMGNQNPMQCDGSTPFQNCDGVHDCSDSLYDHWVGNGWDDPNDKLWMQFELTVPPGTEGYIFDFAYFSSEWPEYIGQQYNDLFIAWSTSESYTGNITFVNDAPLTITSLDDAGAFQYTGNSQQLGGTGFEGHAGTGWFVARGSAVPGETFQLTFFIADMADDILATAVLLDNFRWECAGCIPSEVNDCGIQPQ